MKLHRALTLLASGLAVLVMALALTAAPARAAPGDTLVVNRLSAKRLDASIGVDVVWQDHLDLNATQGYKAVFAPSWKFGKNFAAVASARLPFDNAAHFSPPEWTLGVRYNLIRAGKWHL